MSDENVSGSKSAENCFVVYIVKKSEQLCLPSTFSIFLLLNQLMFIPVDKINHCN